ncbi:hypothetical protein [Psychrobium sp. 1_MG-2023]|uniref:hypothetical protein n=1 Tax=Psychrobium sp. 1_MG-2023 TaxID=3062624 RepID=UPI000C32161D|nr:hypothetical protein [Psychrobium sp. 1_MG-2023]MDP2560132.1 hypothetical protein [Psychrobium sp. 1_MG-2023]PKF56945.1 hypothetical protein CW748_07565 [Alteromonadales bacterium alter-6D02]
MMLSVEISNYPLNEQYIPPIKDFIDRLKSNPDLRISCNTMSTQVFGEYDVVMAILNQEIKDSFRRFGKMIFVCKFINADLDPALNQ